LNLLFGHDKVVADWASKKTGKPLRNWHHAIGVIDNNGLLVGCASFHDFNGSNVELCYFGPGTMSLSIAKQLMRFAFGNLKVNRISARTPRQNKQALKGFRIFGFRMEGVAKHYYGPVKRLDAVMFGMLASDAKKFMERAQ
jgi:RimJ/RimL family protein N-acetyltransferase